VRFGNQGHLDPSGFVKGWAVERASTMLEAAGSRHHLVNGGGDVQAVGTTSSGAPWLVGIVDPSERGRVIQTVATDGGAVATSGTAERGAHIVNPMTGRAADHFTSVTVLSRSLTDADVLATAAFARGASAREWLDGIKGAEGFFVDSTGALTHTRHWPGSAP
jgi:thiamine biosynthesis lipoprotein